MNIIVDLELQQAVQAWGSRQPAQPIQVKSQDTPTMAIYFAKGAINYDIGASPGLRFGLYVAGNPNPLVQQTAFTRTTDAQNRVVYVAYPNFNTTAMLSAIGSQPSLNAMGELRYQTSFGTIARTLDVPFTILRSLLQETVLDSTIAAFTTPAVGSNVTVRINNTGWLSPNLNISIGAGAGAYKVISITNATDFIAQNSGGASNAASGTNIPSGTSVGLAPAQILNAYPDPSIIELTTHKNAANGYAGLTSAGLLATSIIPVDTQTIRFNSNGQLSSSAILTSINASFTTPAANATVSVTVLSTAGLIAGQYVRIPIAGYYQVTTITDATHAVLTNNGDPFNAASGTTISSGAVLLPAQAVSGGGTGAGQPAYTNTTASFVVPAAGSTVPVTVANTSWMGGSGYYVFITGAGYYAVNSITDATHVVLTNTGSASNATPGVTVPSGATVAAAGPAGAAGASGQGLAAYDALTAAFTMPNAGSNVTISISNTAWAGVGQVLYIATAGYMSVIAVSSATQLNVQNLNYPGNASSGTSIASGSHVSPGGLQGAQGAGGAGLNAFTTLSANFTQPAVNSTVTINVGTTAWMASGQGIYVQGGGYYSVSTVVDLIHVTVTNLGTTGNAAPGATIVSGTSIIVSPSGTPGTSGRDAFTTTTASFVMPTTNGTVTVSVGATAWMAQGQNLYLPSVGYMSVAVINSPTSVVLTNIGSSGNANSGTTIASGVSVVAGGAQGLPGPTGAQGPPGSLSNATDAQSAAVSPEVSVIQGIASGTLSLKKLKPGGSGTISLTDNGGTTGDILIDATASGGGMTTADKGIEFQDDFIYYGASPATPYWYPIAVTAVITWQNTVGVDSTNKANGVVQLGGGTGAGQKTALTNANASAYASCNVLVPALGIIDLRFRVWFPSIASSAANYGIYRFGLTNDDGTGLPYHGAFFEYNYGAAPAGNWSASTALNGVVTRNASAIAVVAGQWINLRLLTDAAWGNAYFYVNGTLVKTLTGFTLWTVPVPLAIWNIWGAGTGPSVYLDWVYLKYSYSRGTW